MLSAVFNRVTAIPAPVVSRSHNFTAAGRHIGAGPLGTPPTRLGQSLRPLLRGQA